MNELDQRLDPFADASAAFGDYAAAAPVNYGYPGVVRNPLASIIAPELLPVDHDPFDVAPRYKNPLAQRAHERMMEKTDPVAQRLRQIVGLDGERYQTFLERMVRSGSTLASDAITGKQPYETRTGLPGGLSEGATEVNMEPNWLGGKLGMTRGWSAPGPHSEIGRAQDMSGMAVAGPLAASRGSATLGSGATRGPRMVKPEILEEFNGLDTKIRNALGPDTTGWHAVPDAHVTRSISSVPGQEGMAYWQVKDAKGNWVEGKMAPSAEEAIKMASDTAFRRQGITPQELDRWATLGDKYGLHAPVEGARVRIGGGDTTLMSDSGTPGSGVSALANSKHVAPPFYSAVEHAINTAKAEKMSPEQWAGYLKNQPGVKAEELAWTGLDDPAVFGAGRKAITKQELLDHAQEHGVQIKEIKKEKAGYNEDYLNETTQDRLFNNFIDENPNLNPGTNRFNKAFEKYEKEHFDRVFDEVAAEVSKNETTATKFSDYQLPGGENYREMLFTLPKKIDPAETRIDAINNRLREISELSARETDPKTASGQKYLIEHDKLRAEQRELFKEVQGKSSQQYQSSHWDEPNVLAHVRMNDREIPYNTGRALRIEPHNDKFVVQGFEAKDADPSGLFKFKSREEAQQYIDKEYPSGVPLKTLHLEELQSDWHQAGRKQGYSDPNYKPQIDIVKNPSETGAPHMVTLDGRPDRAFFTQAEAGEHANWLERHTTQDKGVPDVPFKTTWPDLVLKRMIREASQNGYDAISWTPGEAQAARYDLSKQIKDLRYERNADGTYTLGANKNPETWTEIGIGTKIPEAKLADYIGKDVAEKIVKDQGKPHEHGGKVLSGVDLKVGGEGMKAFYDKMLVDKANAIAKKFGGKVEKQKLGEGLGSEDLFDRMTRRFHSENPGLDPRTDQFSTKFEEWSGSPAGRKAEAEINLVPEIHVLRLPPSLKDTAVRKGFPLFAAGLPFSFTPVDYDPFGDK